MGVEGAALAAKESALFCRFRGLYWQSRVPLWDFKGLHWQPKVSTVLGVGGAALSVKGQHPHVDPGGILG